MPEWMMFLIKLGVGVIFFIMLIVKILSILSKKNNG